MKKSLLPKNVVEKLHNAYRGRDILKTQKTGAWNSRSRKNLTQFEEINSFVKQFI